MIVSEASSVDGEWGLPTIRTMLLFAYRAVWLMLFAAGVASTFYFSVRNELAGQARYQAAAALAFAPYTNASAEGQLGEGLGEEGRRLGFKQSDLVLAVDGHALSTDPIEQARTLSGPKGSVATLKLRRSTGELLSLRVARDPQRLARAYAGSGLTFESRRWTQFLFEHGCAVAALAAAALLLILRPRDTIAQLLSVSLVLSYADPSDYAQIGPVALVGLGCIRGMLLVTALLLFPSGRFNSRWQWIALFVSIGSSVEYLLETAGSSMNVNLDVVAQGASSAAIMLAIAMRYRGTPAGPARQQLKFVLLGFVASTILDMAGDALFCVELLPLSEGSLAWIVLAKHISYALSATAVSAGLLASLLRFRLYDAESTISRSVVVGALTLFLLAIFAGSEKVIEILGERYFGEHLGALAGGLGAAIAAVMVAPLHHRVTHWAEHRFQGDLVHLRNALPILVGDMRETATAERLADAVLVRVENGVRATRGAIVVDHEILYARDVDAAAVKKWLAGWAEPTENQGGIHADRDDPLFPLRLPLHSDASGTVGWLLLGPRPDGSFYGKDERETLLSIADPVARALVIARERERNFGGLTEQFASIRDWIDEFRASLDDLRTSLAKIS